MTVESGGGKRSRAYFGVAEWTLFSTIAVAVVGFGGYQSSRLYYYDRVIPAMQQQTEATLATMAELKTLVGVMRETSRDKLARERDLDDTIRGMRSTLSDVKRDLETVKDDVTDLKERR